jgi:hypothetical protein
MTFDVTKLKRFCIAEIRRFAKDHQDETFYAFAIDASLLCLNSEQQFKRTLQEYRERWDFENRPIERWKDLTESDLSDAELMLQMEEEFAGLDRSNKRATLAVINADRAGHRKKGNPYRQRAKMKSLRANTGDWAYQGFAEMTGKVGFDSRAYYRHYDMDDDEQRTSAYGRNMDELVRRLVKSGVFRCLKTSPTFYATRVEHVY